MLLTFLVNEQRKKEPFKHIPANVPLPHPRKEVNQKWGCAPVILAMGRKSGPYELTGQLTSLLSELQTSEWLKERLMGPEGCPLKYLLAVHTCICVHSNPSPHVPVHICKYIINQ